MITYGSIKSGEAAVPAAKVAPVAKEIGRLPALVEAAVAQLAKAKDAAEVLDAKDKASLIYDAAKRAARLAAAKGAHDTLIAEAHRAQANALKIEAQAKERLADEYDAAQERGEIQKPGGDRKTIVPERNNDAAKVEETGLTRKQVHDARRIRNAEQAKPGVVDDAVEQAIAEGKEPTRAVVNAAVTEALGEDRPAKKPRIILDELVALWCEAGQEDRDGFIAYLRILGFKIEPPSLGSVNPDTEVAADANTGGGHVDHDNPNAFSIAGAPSQTAPAPSAGANDAAGDTNSPERATESTEQPTAAAKVTTPEANTRGQTGTADRPARSPVPASAKAVAKKVGQSGQEAAVELPVDANSNPRPNTSPDVDMAGEPQDRNEPVSGSPAPFTNPRCQKPDTCKWAHSMASCSPCNDAWARAKVSA